MDAESMKLLATGLAIAIGVIGPALAIGRIGAAAADSIGRNPDAAPKIQTAMILSAAFAEALGIYALVVAFIIKFT